MKDSITLNSTLYGGDKTFYATEQEFAQPSGNQDIDTTDEYDVTDKATARVSEEEREKLIPENIKSGVTILGVEGTYQGE